MLEIRCGLVDNVVSRHPLIEVKKAAEIIDHFRINGFNNETHVFYSSSPDFCQTIYHYGELHKIEVNFVLNGEKSTLEDVFKDFNKSIDLIKKLLGIDGED